MEENKGVYLLYLVADNVFRYEIAVKPNMTEKELNFHTSAFVGEPLPNDWALPEHKAAFSRKPLCDFIFGHENAPYISNYAMNCLLPIVSEHVEFRSIGFVKKVPYFVMNVTRVIDCLDLNKSQIFTNSIGQTKVWSAIFGIGIEKGIAIFKVPQDYGWIFVNDVFVQTIRNCGITGVGFEKPENPGFAIRNNAFDDLPRIFRQ